MEILSDHSTREPLLGPDGKQVIDPSNGRPVWKLTTGAKIRYLDDNAQWQSVVHGSADKLPGNCEFVPAYGAYRLWKPNGTPPYNPAWLDTDYFLVVFSDTATFTPRRTTILEQNLGAFTQEWSPNLTRTVEDEVEVWRNAAGEIIFARLPAQTDEHGVTKSELRFA